MSKNPDKPVRVGVNTALSGVLLFLVAKLGCCGLPALVALLGALGISSSFLEVLKPLQPVFIFLAICGVTWSLIKAYKPCKEGCERGPSRFSKGVALVCALFVIGVLVKETLARTVPAEPDACGCAPAPVKSCCSGEGE